MGLGRSLNSQKKKLLNDAKKHTGISILSPTLAQFDRRFSRLNDTTVGYVTLASDKYPGQDSVYSSLYLSVKGAFFSLKYQIKHID